MYKILLQSYMGVAKIFGRGSTLWSEAKKIVSGEEAFNGMGVEGVAPGKFTGFYVNFRPGVHL